MRWLLNLVLLFTLFLDGDQGGGSGDGDPDKDEKPTAEKVADQARKLLAKHGQDAIAAIAFLMSEGYHARDRARKAEAKVEVLEAGGAKAPEGGMVLTKDQATQWAEYLKIGTPAEIQQGMEERKNLGAEHQKTQREKLLSEVAEVTNFRMAPLTRLARKEDGTDLVFEVKDEMVEGEQVKVAYVTDGTETTKVVEYAEAHWEEFLPALQREESSDGSARRNGASRYFPGQERGDAASRNNSNNNSGSTAARRYINEKYAVPGKKQEK